jgi:hypothetical protein
MLEIEHLLAEASVDCAGRDMALAFLAKDSSIPRYVLGRNQQAVDCMRCARVEGVVDDFASAGSLWNGVPVVTSSALPAGAQ